MMATGKTWHEGGIYSRVCKRTTGGAPLRVYYGQVKVNGRLRYFRLGTALKAAQRKMNGIKGDPAAALAEREKPRPPFVRFDELVKEFLGKYESRGGTSFYNHTSLSWLAYFKKTDVATITRAKGEDFRDHLKAEGYGPSTIRKYVGALGTMFRWAKGRGLLADNPVEGVKRPSEPDRQVAVLSTDEEARLLEAADPQTRIMLELHLASGMRKGEGLDLRWGQVDRSGEAILIHKTKTSMPR
jgi:integrase